MCGMLGFGVLCQRQVCWSRWGNALWHRLRKFGFVNYFLFDFWPVACVVCGFCEWLLVWFWNFLFVGFHGLLLYAVLNLNFAILNAITMKSFKFSSRYNNKLR